MLDLLQVKSVLCACVDQVGPVLGEAIQNGLVDTLLARLDVTTRRVEESSGADLGVTEGVDGLNRKAISGSDLVRSYRDRERRRCDVVR